jgi:hypothetical protein
MTSVLVVKKWPLTHQHWHTSNNMGMQWVETVLLYFFASPKAPTLSTDKQILHTPNYRSHFLGKTVMINYR